MSPPPPAESAARAAYQLPFLQEPLLFEVPAVQVRVVTPFDALTIENVWFDPLLWALETALTSYEVLVVLDAMTLTSPGLVPHGTPTSPAPPSAASESQAV